MRVRGVGKTTKAGLIGHTVVREEIWTGIGPGAGPGVSSSPTQKTRKTRAFPLLIVIAGLGATVLRSNEELMVATSEAGDADRDHDLLHARQAVCDAAVGGRRETSDCATNHTGLGSHPWPDASREPPS
jgi:hypothetical protein